MNQGEHLTREFWIVFLGSGTLITAIGLAAAEHHTILAHTALAFASVALIFWSFWALVYMAYGGDRT